ncbi:MULTISPECIES: hypothetical protein [unclassified Gordonia (in: high G+C Gram-positive bacteria)]|uniref:hypothetical protein n=1 Tax=unclassified Gordonia (in: high G+C Gram-positive bacteria) TaxID=2657482 RepID=UPI0020003DC4|nr:hypothetical protein [Gordonia sp. PP30]UQE75976.1 hypothetical protein MYK68_05100 [Gordonia sp. PP30]
MADPHALSVEERRAYAREIERKKARIIVIGRIKNGQEVDPELLALADFSPDEMPKRAGRLWRFFFERKQFV